jgi:3-hydroxybutyrate dehydrogenase
MTIDITEPVISREQILVLPDPNFNCGNVCIVTGVASGIGRATAIAAATNQLFTIGLDVDEKGGHETETFARSMGGQMVFIRADLTQDEDVIRAVGEATKLGQIKYVANIAGIQHIDPVENFPMDRYDFMHRLMLRAPLLMSKLTIPHMKKSADGCGVIANMASVHAHICTMNKPAYNIVKFGLRGLTQSIAAEGKGKIRAFTVSTGFVKTALALKQIPAQAQQRGISQEAVVRDVMMGFSRVKEMMSPVDVANLFMFGFSSYGKYLVGGDMLFDGGMVLTYGEDKKED